ncbi:MAG: acetone carboxylase subunit gamma [Acidimicrobiia bacterium]|nr:acetone carboxylase subunit gamma [Acidimicrobiia bacterium]
MSRVRITETLDIELDDEQWVCNRCDTVLGPARENYKLHLRAWARDPETIHPPLVEGEISLSPKAAWGMLVELYCPGCGVMVENELLPPGHPLTHDIELDLDDLRRRVAEAGR